MRISIAALLALALAPGARGAVFIHDETLHGDLSDDYLMPALFSPGAGSSTLKGTVVDGDRDLFTLVVAAGLRLDSLRVLSYTTDSENPENLSYMMSQPGALLSSPPSNDFADPIGYVGFGAWAVGRNVLRTITAGPPYDYAATLGPGSYAFWINETGPTSGYEFQFNVTAVPEASALLGILLSAPICFRRRRDC
ncbi:MAG: hypothetical protein RLZZ214_1771 [Verrucomicrobiota bacterium]|jgi:hypothetical protein